jgi:hypothetical protein
MWNWWAPIQSMIEVYVGLDDSPICQPLTTISPGAYHVGDEPDDRTMSTLRSHGIRDYVHAARKVSLCLGPWLPS